MARKMLDATINNSLVNIVAPSALKFEKDVISWGQVEAIGYSVTRYPSSATYGWLTDVCNLNNTITSLTYTPEQNIEGILKAIGNTVSNNTPIAEGTASTNPVEQVRARKIVDDGTKTIEQIANNNESIGYVSLNTMVIGSDRQDARNKAKAVKNKFVGNKFIATLLPFMQKEIMRAVSPCDNSSELMNDVTNQLMPISTMLGGFPFAFSGYNDGEGSVFGKDSSGGLIVVDPWRRGSDRTNSNVVLMGVSGVGKSTALKHLILNEWELGTKFVIIDPHGEYKEMCQNLDGDWIDVVGGTGGRINPLHIYIKDKTEEEEKKALNYLAIHINNLEVFFNLYLDLNTLLTAVLKECIELTYKSKGIVWETDITKVKSEQFPIMSDLYEVVQQMAKENEKELKRSETNYYKELGILLRNIAIGSDSFIWNGHSTVNTTKDFVVFDTTTVNGNSNNIKTTLYHTVLNYCEDYLYKNKDERVILIVDEAHNVIDKRLPATVSRLANIEKSCRKFESAVWICSQQLIDFLDEAIRKEGQTLLDQPNIKLLMPVGKGRDLKELKELYNLTDAEEERLMQQQRGKGLIFIGSRRLSIDFEIPHHHFELMGTGGGR